MAVRTKMDAGTSKPKYRYRVTNWAEYDRALGQPGRSDDLVRRGDASGTAGRPRRPVGRGKPGLYSQTGHPDVPDDQDACSGCPTAPPKG
jgi:hypothetical protein